MRRIGPLDHVRNGRQPARQGRASSFSRTDVRQNTAMMVS